MSVTSDELYARDKNLKCEDVTSILQWTKEQPHLPPLEEYQIIIFLYACYYQPDQAKIKIDKYFTLNTHYPQLFNCLDEEKLRSTMEFVFIKILPQTTPEGYSIFLVKLLDYNADLFIFSRFAKLLTMIMALDLYQKGFEKGTIGIVDTEGFSFMHLARMRYGMMKLCLDYIQEAVPVRIKGVHIINAVPAVEKLKILGKPFVATELYNTVEIHSSPESLYEKVPQKCLPKDYGGGAPSLQVLQEENLKTLLDNYSYFRWHYSQKVDESKRVKEGWSFFGWQF